VGAVYPVVVASLCTPKAALPIDSLLRTVEVRTSTITKAAVVIVGTLFVQMLGARRRISEQAVARI